MLKKSSKRFKALLEKLSDRSRAYAVEAAIKLAKECATAKFVESLDVAVNLGIDPAKSDQTVRSSVLLPKGTGRNVRVAVLAQAKQAELAASAGAEWIGFEDLAEKIKNGFSDFDVLIATPDAMRLVGQLGKILGPRGLMPNPKAGTVTADVEKAVRNAKAGQIQYRADKAGIIHCSIGRANFSVEDLKENLETLLSDLKKNKPASSKGIFFKKIKLSSTMGPGILIDQTDLNI